ncbi:MAG: NADH-quinone oxidoreductase subunit H [Candidatus Diapherotrites archaeon]|uniref:NADH-quinone oxidoreductase subunit H n=1 Tax=Candidatus Iainarchaeum sp. TaxID=3101447 RepID=A0A939C4I2_9ARCH|nr:NADH-quinone oxidoreductase subunit H [Candidatus Diapherotrites archaeon]
MQLNELIIYQLASVPAIAALGIILGLLFKGIDRVLAARMQARIGPPIRQPFRDLRKLMIKENIVPKNAVRFVFNGMPLLAVAASITILLYVPIAGFLPLMQGYGDLILLLYLLLIPSLALVLGGFASASPYASIGAQREMVSMISYELPLAVAVASIAWLFSRAMPGIASFSLAAIAANPVWELVGPVGFIGLLALFLILLAVMPGEIGVIPFDTAEAETEIASGMLVEYSGRNLALFYLADAVKTVGFASILIAIFLPYGISGTLSLQGANAVAADALFFLLKLFIVVFIGRVLIRVAVPRLRITQVVKAYWGYATIAALCGLSLIALDAILLAGGC